jgi:hypothetical protein
LSGCAPLDGKPSITGSSFTGTPGAPMPTREMRAASPIQTLPSGPRTRPSGRSSLSAMTVKATGAGGVAARPGSANSSRRPRPGSQLPMSTSQ